MNPRWLVRLYPAAWRTRYGEEFVALLEDRPPSARQVIDIVLGAIDAHLFPPARRGRYPMFTRVADSMLRFTGLAALVAGLALLIGLIPLRVDVVEGLGPVEIATYTVPVFYVLAFIGSVGIHLRQTPIRPNLAWPAFVAVVLGLVIGSSSVSLGMYGGGIPNSDWGLLQGIGLWVASAAFGAAIVAIGAIPRVVGLALIVGASLALIGPVAGDALSSSELLSTLSRTGIAIYGLGWVLAAVSLLTVQPREPVPDLAVP